MNLGHRLRCWSAVGTTVLIGTLLWSNSFEFISLPGVGQDSPDPLTILIWHWPFHSPMELSGDVCLDLYGIRGCRLTANRSEFHQSHVVVFHHKEMGEKGFQFPAKDRPLGQKWVWASLESPSHMHRNMELNNIFNWTLSYRSDSDIFVPYGMMVPQPAKVSNFPNKTRVVSWVVSNYRRSQERANFYANLSHYLKVDVYGTANRKPLCPSCLLPTISRYQFYLALENSVHPDYITEKLWHNSFQSGAIPIVLGPPRENYEKFIPADSFIHISDFPSPKHLAHFLLSMSKERYRRFFQWRERLSVKTYKDWRERFCWICGAHPSLAQHKVYMDLHSWVWNRTKN
ncbi:alpha-(1,3)-fucosyltransferase 7 [Xenopus laevis]|uniref:Fucosyltransferase n=2 Tax=Xenopus laevis TaxID=8355 RepID=A0A1L8F5U1_XENLA|nr:alpha-(1,3)-fucosyltransferase 7 [Xenopus laevis]OCT66947.1 hypothetical protein XELAEV_18038229mg [Xenopus laevis]